ncbi:MAG TPA: hypothetical protein VLH79_02205 [Chthonomonadales bacterium]|nr:hypothetical protein [Chthonomonadales bacterium]
MDETAGGGTIGLCVAPDPPPNAARSCSCPAYAREILAHAGLFMEEVQPGGLEAWLRDGASRVLLMAGDHRLGETQAAALECWCAEGRALVGVGSAMEAGGVWGVEPENPPAGWAVGAMTAGEGYIEPIEPEHPIMAGLRSRLHHFNGAAVRAVQATAIARLLDSHARPTSRAAVTVRHIGRGAAVLIAPDLPGAVEAIQFGRHIDRDGVPAPDGTAPLSDGVLKAEDGIVLDWTLDRDTVPGVPYPLFLHPVADELREVLLRAILFAARAVRAPLRLLWRHPDGAPARAHLSHDSDGNDPGAGLALLEVVRDLGLRNTWCIQPPGYPRSFCEELLSAGQEIALHFDALEQGEGSLWTEDCLARQYEAITRLAAPQPVVTNKNHYTRWEGRTGFLRWCAAQGIRCDQSRGPTKRGDSGFPFGTALPHFAMEADGSAIDCLELGFLSQDFVVTLPLAAMEPLVDSVARVHGIAHVIFHPAHIRSPGVEAGLRAFVDACRRREMPLGTAAEIAGWERARRSARLTRCAAGWQLEAPAPLQGATVLSLLPEGAPADVERWGFGFAVSEGYAGPEGPLRLRA